MVLLLFTFCLLLLPLWKSVIVRTVFCCTLLYVHSSFAIILMGKRELVALLSLPSWCLVMVVWLFLAVPWVCLRLVIVVLSDNTPLLFIIVHLASFTIFVLQQQQNLGRSLTDASKMHLSVSVA